MEYIISGTTSTYYPTYMNPENGAIFPPSTSTNVATAVRSTYAVGEAYATSVESYNYQQVSSSSASPSASPSVAYDINESEYSQWLATANMTDLDSSDTATATATDSDSSPSTSTSAGMSPLKIATVGVPAIVGLVLLVVGIWCCCRCKRRRRERKRTLAHQQGGGEGGNGEMREVERQGHVPRYNHDQRPQSLTRDEVMGVVASAPSGTSVRRPTPSQLSYPYGSQSDYPNNRRYLTPSVGGSRHSRWTDDSEFDVMAEDGSTITRTLSTTSTRRSGLTEIPEGRMDDNSNINPFDHPAYTYRSAPQQLSRGQTPLSRNGTLSSGQGTGTGTWSSQSQLPPLSFQSTQSPISPITPTAAAPPYIQPLHSQSQTRQTQRQGDTYSIHSSEDGDIYGTPRPGLRREPTIIRHSDSSLAQGTAKVEKRGRDGVVELPPLYEDATSGWAR